ncbi:MAG: VOC family protein [Epulopiscium sp.]|nr:VOC family protein [Candidatus Epulonipiscium sp.]
MKFCWSTLTVNDMEESLKFYQEIVGLKINRRFNAGSGVEIVFLGDGETQIELMTNTKDTKVNIGEDIAWGFEVESLDEMLALVKEKGINIHSGPVQPSPQIRFFNVLDPNGLSIQFVENIKED